MGRGEAVVNAPHLNEGSNRNQDVDGQHDGGHQEAEAAYQTHNLGIVDHGAFPGSLAGYGDVGLLFNPVLGQDEEDDGDIQQHHRYRGAALYVVAADGLQVHLGGQGGEVAADGHGVGEVGYGFDEHQQEGVGDAGPYQGDRHRTEGAPLGGTQVPGRVFNAGVDGLQHARQQQERDGEIGDRLYEDQAFQPVDVGVAPAQETVSYQAPAAEQHDDGQGHGERRRYHRQQRHQVEQLFTFDGKVRGTVGEEEADRGGQHPYDDRQHQGIHQRLIRLAHGHDVDVGLQAEVAVQVREALLHHHQQRPHHKDKKSQDHTHRDRCNNRIPERVPGCLNLIRYVSTQLSHLGALPAHTH